MNRRWAVLEDRTDSRASRGLAARAAAALVTPAAAWVLLTPVPAFGQGPGPWFTEVTTDAGLAAAPGYRLSVADLNGDGYPDLVIHTQSGWGSGNVLDNQHVYLNVTGDDPFDPFSRKFVDYTSQSNIRADRAGTGGGRHSDSAIFADVDNDGDLDAFTLVYVHDNYTLSTNTNELLLNDGSAHFTIAPSSPFHTEPIYNTAAAVFAETDNDGKIDLFIGNWYKPASTLTSDQLYLGGGDGTFTNVTGSSGISGASTSVYAVAAWDWDDDGDTDLFAPTYSRTVFGAESRQWRNNGNGTYTQVQASTNYNDYTGWPFQKVSFGSMPRDFDNDGDIDYMELLTHGDGDGSSGVHTTGIANVNGVFSWDFARVYDRATEDPDITHHGDHYSTWFDLDNDTLVDFSLTESGYGNNRFYIFQQASNHSFTPVTVDAGLNGINTANLPPHNVIALDYDRDGDQDLIVGFASNSLSPQLWRNDVGTNNNWITVTLKGAGGAGFANASAIGAKVTLTAGGVTQTQEIYAGNGHHGPQGPLDLAFGLGAATLVDSITVRWPNATLSQTVHSQVEVNRFVTIREVCTAAADPANLTAAPDGTDVLLAWDEPAGVVWDWNLYRDASPDPMAWGLPHAAHTLDGDLLAPGIQHRDAGAGSTPDTWFYRVTAFNDCGESPL